MQRSSRIGHLGVLLMAIVLAACAGQKEPAEKLINEIQATVTAASAEAGKYIPEQLMGVQTQLSALKASFDKQDYAAVVSGAPPVLTAARGLATAAAEKKDDALKELNDKWTALADSVPSYLTAVQNRVEYLAKKANKKTAAGIDLDGAKSALSDAMSLWSKAQAAFATGNLDEAVSTAQDVKSKVLALASRVNLDLTAAPVKS